MEPVKEGQATEAITVLELLEQMKEDESWCEDDVKRTGLVNRMIFFIIEN